MRISFLIFSIAAFVKFGPQVSDPRHWSLHFCQLETIYHNGGSLWK